LDHTAHPHLPDSQLQQTIDISKRKRKKAVVFVLYLYSRVHIILVKLPRRLPLTMGNEVSGPKMMEKTLFNMKFTSRQLVTESRKCEAKSKAEVSVAPHLPLLPATTGALRSLLLG
jgi:hypothetical protein